MCVCVRVLNHMYWILLQVTFQVTHTWCLHHQFLTTACCWLDIFGWWIVPLVLKKISLTLLHLIHSYEHRTHYRVSVTAVLKKVHHPNYVWSEIRIIKIKGKMQSSITTGLCVFKRFIPWLPFCPDPVSVWVIWSYFFAALVNIKSCCSFLVLKVVKKF